MIAAHRPNRGEGKLLVVDQRGNLRHLPRADLGELFEPGDLIVANDAATIPGSLHGHHDPTGEAVEVRLATFVEAGDPTRFIAIAFGAGDHRTTTEERPAPPPLARGDELRFGPLVATIEHLLEHPRLLMVQFHGQPAHVYAGLARHGRPIQYAHVPEAIDLWDVWASVAARPFAFEAPSAGFALDWAMVDRWHQRAVEVATLTHAAGISSTGDPALDRLLPFDEHYVIPEATATSIEHTKANGGKVIAVGTTVVRALESAATDTGTVRAGEGIARGRIGPATQIRVVDSVLSGMHEPGESHFDLLQAFADENTLKRAHRSALDEDYRSHEFGDFLLIDS